MTRENPFIRTFHAWVEMLLHRSMQATIQFARENGLSMSMVGTLIHLNRTGHAGVSDLGQHLGVSNAAASQMLDHLVQEGLIERAEDPGDRRMKKITLTEKGCRISGQIVRARMGWLEKLEDSLSDGERDQVISALQLMIAKARGIERSLHESR